MRTILPIIVVISITFQLNAQQLIPVGYNHALKKQNEEKHGFKSANNSTLITPPLPDADHFFFEDFSYYHTSVFPNPDLWSEGKTVFVNQTYPDSCVSIGVATLDGVNENGDLYSTDNGHYPSDTLISTDISLDWGPEEEKVYFSFFFQGGGKGDAPNEKDTLKLEFFNSDSSKWYRIWDTVEVKSNTFQQVIIPVDTLFRGTAFKFRFTNWTTTDNREVDGNDESGVANSDLWHIDYIQLKKADTEDAMKVINDAAFVYPLMPTHSLYHALPYKHLTFSQGDRRPTSDIVVRTSFRDILGAENSVTVKRTHATYNIYKGQRVLLNLSEEFENEQFDEFVKYTDDFTSAYNHNGNQSYGLFEYMSYLDIRPEQYRWNDTVKKIEVYKDYYAYDDGTAEYGFGLPGNGGVNMRLAYKFPLAINEANPEDTLTAIDFHFIKTRNNASSDVEFQICVWEQNGDEPGELLYPPITEKGELDGPVLTPDTNLGINEFMRVKLIQELIVRGTIYIGFIQKNIGMLGIGYDINSNSRSQIYTNDGTQWRKTSSSIPAGALMMRPVFGNYVYVGTEEHKSDPVKEMFRVYPNPVKDKLTIEPLAGTGDIANYRVSVFNVLGKCVVNELIPEQNVDFSSYPSGLYLVKIRNVKTSEYSIHKVLKNE